MFQRDEQQEVRGAVDPAVGRHIQHGQRVQFHLFALHRGQQQGAQQHARRGAQYRKARRARFPVGRRLKDLRDHAAQAVEDKDPGVPERAFFRTALLYVRGNGERRRREGEAQQFAQGDRLAVYGNPEQKRQRHAAQHGKHRIQRKVDRGEGLQAAVEKADAVQPRRQRHHRRKEREFQPEAVDREQSDKARRVRAERKHHGRPRAAAAVLLKAVVEPELNAEHGHRRGGDKIIMHIGSRKL